MRIVLNQHSDINITSSRLDIKSHTAWQQGAGKVSRSSGDSDVGISKFIFLGGTNEFAELKGKECTYAVSYFKDKIFGNNRCKIGKDLFEKLKK